jgi:hypothetical protein
MFVNKPKNNNALLAAFNALALRMPSIRETQTSSPDPSRSVNSSRKKTKKGATHVIGAHFKPKFLFFNPADGTPITPAMYGRLHMARQRKRQKHGSQHSS